MSDTMTTPEAAAALGTSAETIRTLIRDGLLTGRQNDRGWWLVERRSVDDFLTEYGPLNGGRRGQVRRAIPDLPAAHERSRVVDEVPSAAAVVRERDELRARVVVLEDSLAALRDAADLQRQADVERSEVVKQLLAALAGSERSDVLRARAIKQLEDALARATVPGYLTAT